MLKVIHKQTRQLKALLLYVFNGLLDSVTLVFGFKDELTPPRRLMFVGEGNFKKTGDEFLKYFIELGELKPTDQVLEVGCGIGRMAIPLTRYLNREGSYEGFDIVPTGIRWCQEKITPNYPNFHFQLADIMNKRYFPNGSYRAEEYKFPFADQSFDFIFLTSVFTHMLPLDMENYLSEISRVLKKKGRCLITYFLLNEESMSHIKEKRSALNFRYNRNEYCVEDEDMPEGAISYNEKYIRILFEKYKLGITEPIRYGSWCGRKKFLSFQDIMVIQKI